MNIRTGLTGQEYEDIGRAIGQLAPHELLKVLEGVRQGHSMRRQQDGTSKFLGSDRYLGVAMDWLAEHAARKNGSDNNHERQMIG